MKIRIVKADSPHFWYANKIGEVFTAIEYKEVYDMYLTNAVLEDPRELGYVSPEDCEEVIEHNSQLYRKVDRPVREGDTVLITKFAGEPVSLFRTVVENEDYSSFFDVNEFIDDDCKLVFKSNEQDEYFVLEPIEQPVQPSAPSYAEVSELLYEAKPKEESDLITHNGKQYRKVKRKAAVGDLVISNVQVDGRVYRVYHVYENGVLGKYSRGHTSIGTNDYFVLELVEQSGQTETLTELDLIANLAQEVAELKRELHRIESTVLDHVIDITDLEDRVDEGEKDTEELIGRINDLGDGAEANAVDFKALIESLTKMMFDTRDAADYYRTIDLPQTAMHQSGISRGLDIAITKIEGALRNG